MKKNALRIVFDILKFSIIAYIVVKILSVAYIFAHNIFEPEQWPYTYIWSMYGVEVTDYFSPLIFGPVVETIVFCVMLSYLLAKYFQSKWVFILFSASTIAPYHLIASDSGSFTLMYTFSLGLLFAFIFWKYKQKYNA